MIRSLLRNLNRLFMAAVLLVLSLCAVEVGLRAVRLKARMQSSAAGPQNLSSRNFTQQSRTTYIDVIPLLDASQHADNGASHPIRTDEWGLRGPSAEVPKPQGAYRVLCLGAEETFAAHLDEQATYTHQLQRLLQRGTPLKVEVLNGGCPDAGPLINVLRLRHLAALQPDLIVFTLSPLDLQRNMEVHRFLQLDESGHPRHAIHPLMQKDPTLIDEVCNEFYTAEWAAEFMSRGVLVPNGISSKNIRRRSDQPVSDEVEAKLAKTTFAELAELSRGIYARCTVAVCPSVWDIRSPESGAADGARSDSDRYRKLLHDLSGETAIPIYDATDEIRSHPQLRSLYSASAGQLSAEGHALFANLLARSLVETIPGLWSSAR